jgi:hypothetical protein
MILSLIAASGEVGCANGLSLRMSARRGRVDRGVALVFQCMGCCSTGVPLIQRGHECLDLAFP